MQKSHQIWILWLEILIILVPILIPSSSILFSSSPLAARRSRSLALSSIIRGFKFWKSTDASAIKTEDFERERAPPSHRNEEREGGLQLEISGKMHSAQEKWRKEEREGVPPLEISPERGKRHSSQEKSGCIERLISK